MSVEIIQQKLLTYQCKTVLEQENALKEIAQEIALMALSRAGFLEWQLFREALVLEFYMDWKDFLKISILFQRSQIKILTGISILKACMKNLVPMVYIESNK